MLITHYSHTCTQCCALTSCPSLLVKHCIHCKQASLQQPLCCSEPVHPPVTGFQQCLVSKACSTTLVMVLQVLVTAFTVVPSRSGAVRTFEQRAVLEQFNPRCVAVSLSGYIFFGSSVSISEKVMEVCCLVANNALAHATQASILPKSTLSIFTYESSSMALAACTRLVRCKNRKHCCIECISTVSSMDPYG